MNFSWATSHSQNKIYRGYFLIDFLCFRKYERTKWEEKNLKEMYEPCLWNIEDCDFKLVKT